MPNALAIIPRTFGGLGRGLQSLGRRALGLEPGTSQGAGLFGLSVAGVTVTPQTALTLSAFFCGVNVLSTDVGKLPYGLYREARGGGQKIARTDQRHRLVRFKPNPLMNSMRYRQMQMGHVLGWGGHTSRIDRDKDGNPIALWPLHPSTKPITEGDGAAKRVLYLDPTTNKKYRPEDVIHIAGLGWDGLTGYNPTLVGREAIGLGKGAEQFGASLFGNGARPGGFLRTPRKLTADAAKRLRETFEAVHGGSQQANRTAVLEEGMEWQDSQISPEAAQFLLTRQFQVLEIARLLNMPPHKLGDYSQAHMTNVEESNLDYTSSTLQGWLTAIEAEYDAKLLFDDELDRYSFRHDMNALMRGNMTARSGYYKSRFSVGSITPNEIRQAEGDNPIKEPNADKCYLQAQNVPLDKAGEAMSPTPAPGAEPDPDPDASNEPDPNDPNEAKEPTEPKPKAKKRFNPNHAKDGKFGGGHGSGSGGGGGHGLSQDEMISRSTEIGEKLADHPHPVPEVVKETGVTPPGGWEGEKTSEHAELVKDQKAEVKDLEKEQASEAKAFDREQAAELKAFEREQKAEAKARKRDGEDPETIASDQHGEREGFLGEQKDALDSFVGDQKDHAASVLSSHHDDRAEMIGGFALDLFETAQEGQE